MADWTWVVFPAFLTALAIRIDALLIGPYFAFSSLVAGFEGIGTESWYSRSTLKWALVRRFAYPFLLGLILSMSGMTVVDTGATAVLAIVLLLWPALFQPLPYGVSRRDWQVWILYALLPAAFFGLSVAGWYLPEMVRVAADGDVVGYLLDLARDWLLTALATTFVVAFIRGSSKSLHEKAEARAALGSEYDFTGGSAFMDSPPLDPDGSA